MTYGAVALLGAALVLCADLVSRWRLSQPNNSVIGAVTYNAWFTQLVESTWRLGAPVMGVAMVLLSWPMEQRSPLPHFSSALCMALGLGLTQAHAFRGFEAKAGWFGYAPSADTSLPTPSPTGAWSVGAVLVCCGVAIGVGMFALDFLRAGTTRDWRAGVAVLGMVGAYAAGQVRHASTRTDLTWWLRAWMARPLVAILMALIAVGGVIVARRTHTPASPFRWGLALAALSAAFVVAM